MQHATAYCNVQQAMGNHGATDNKTPRSTQQAMACDGNNNRRRLAIERNMGKRNALQTVHAHVLIETLQRMQRDKEARTIESQTERSKLHAALQVRFVHCVQQAPSTHVVSGC